MQTKHLNQWIWQLPGWPKLTWDAATLAAPLAAARHAQGELSGVGSLLDSGMSLSAQLEILTAEGIATSAIEGERFDRNALRSSLARRLGLSTAGLHGPTRSTEGLADILLDAAQSYRESLTLKKLLAWQAALFPTGRSGLHKVRVDELRIFLEWFNSPPACLDGLLRAGLAHAWFELIHPFDDGNGRVGRALLDHALAQDENRAVRLYSLSARFMTVRDEYYAALEQVSRDSLDVTPWLTWFLDNFTAAVRGSQHTLGHVLRKARFWMQHAQNPLNERQRKALNLMLDAGPQGFVGGMTNRKYVRLTKASPATAQRDLAQLVELQCLSPVGTGRSVHYELLP